eukprot:2271563-Pleurochrysis_carterae.AAC.3
MEVAQSLTGSSGHGRCVEASQSRTRGDRHGKLLTQSAKRAERRREDDAARARGMSRAARVPEADP